MRAAGTSSETFKRLTSCLLKCSLLKILWCFVVGEGLYGNDEMAKKLVNPSLQ